MIHWKSEHEHQETFPWLVEDLYLNQHSQIFQSVEDMDMEPKTYVVILECN